MGMKVDVRTLRELAEKINDPAGMRVIDQIPYQKGVAALIAQAIADNFQKEGPGWEPLSPATIRASLSKAKRKKLKKFSDHEIATYEAHKRSQGQVGMRNILRRTNVLYKSVTTPGAKGNIYKPETGKIVWGTDLVYSAVHNYGYMKRGIPKREYMVIRAEWQAKLEKYMLDRVVQVLMAANFK